MSGSRRLNVASWRGHNCASNWVGGSLWRRVGRSVGRRVVTLSQNSQNGHPLSLWMTKSVLGDLLFRGIMYSIGGAGADVEHYWTYGLRKESARVFLKMFCSFDLHCDTL